MTYRDIVFEQRDRVGVVTLNRPHKLNAMTNVMLDDIVRVVERATFDESIRALVIRGAGRGFCAGDDLSGMGEFPRPVPPGHKPQADYQHAVILAVRHLQKPVIASIHGYCLGMGHDLAMACDFRIAARSAIIGEPRIARGMHVTTGATYLLPRLVGLTKAIEMLMLAEPVSAEEALRIGLVTRVVDDERLEDETMALAQRLASGPTRAIGILKAQVYGELDMTLQEAFRDMLYWRTFEIEDRQEGIRAFLEKRKPRFTGR